MAATTDTFNMLFVKYFILVLLVSLSFSGLSLAESNPWTPQAFYFYWPQTVRVYIEDTQSHTWTDGERRIARHAMARKLWHQRRFPVTQAIPGKETPGDRFRVRETKCEIVHVNSRHGAHIIVRVAPCKVSHTTLPTTGLPVIITIRPEDMTGFPAYTYGLVIDHEFDHLTGGQHQ